MVTTRARSSGRAPLRANQQLDAPPVKDDNDADSQQTPQRRSIRNSTRVSGQSRASKVAEEQQTEEAPKLTSQQSDIAPSNQQASDAPHSSLDTERHATASDQISPSISEAVHAGTISMSAPPHTSAHTNEDEAGTSQLQQTQPDTYQSVPIPPSSSHPVASVTSTRSPLKSHPISFSPSHAHPPQSKTAVNPEQAPAVEPAATLPDTQHEQKRPASHGTVQSDQHTSQVSQQQQHRASQDSDTDTSDDDSSKEDGDDDGDLEFSNENMLQQLANSIRSAFHATAGSNNPAHAHAQPAAQTATWLGSQAAAGQQGKSGGNSQDVDIALGDDSDDEMEELEREAALLQWKPDVQLPVAELSNSLQAAVARGKEKGLSKQLVVPVRDARQLAKAARGAAPDTAGKAWFDLPATRITDELKRELRLLRLRNAYDPKHHYKSFDTTAFPKYFQVGTVVEGATEFHSSRLTNRERQSNITEELLHDPNVTHSRKKRYMKLQEETQKWSKHKRRKTENPREKARKSKPRY